MLILEAKVPCYEQICKACSEVIFKKNLSCKLKTTSTKTVTTVTTAAVAVIATPTATTIATARSFDFNEKSSNKST